jgi:Ca2+-binding EF-hand superfamily protein
MSHKDRILAIFHSLDSNKNGVLEESDFIAAAKHTATLSKTNDSSPEGKAIIAGFHAIWKGISAADANKDGKVTKDEFVSYWEKIIGSSKSFADYPAFYREIVDNAFKAADTDKSGVISKEEYVVAFQKATGSSAHADEGYNYVAGLGAGKITHAAFQAAAFHALNDADDKAFKAYPFVAPKAH